VQSLREGVIAVEIVQTGCQGNYQ